MSRYVNLLPPPRARPSPSEISLRASDYRSAARAGTTGHIVKNGTRAQINRWLSLDRLSSSSLRAERDGWRAVESRREISRRDILRRDHASWCCLGEAVVTRERARVPRVSGPVTHAFPNFPHSPESDRRVPPQPELPPAP